MAQGTRADEWVRVSTHNSGDDASLTVHLCCCWWGLDQRLSAESELFNSEGTELFNTEGTLIQVEF